MLQVACDEAVWAAELELMGAASWSLALTASLGRPAIAVAALREQALAKPRI